MSIVDFDVRKQLRTPKHLGTLKMWFFFMNFCLQFFEKRYMNLVAQFNETQVICNGIINQK